MEDILQGYGIKPQGKSAPMAASKTGNPVTGSFNFNFPANTPKSSSLNPKSASLNDAFGTNVFTPYDDVFGGAAPYSSHHSVHPSGYEDIFQSFPSAPPQSSTGPVFDAPRYDDDIFGGVSGVKTSNTVVYEDVFSVGSSGPANIEDLLGGFKAAEPAVKSKVASDAAEDLLGGFKAAEPKVASPPHTTAFDDLLPGFGNSEPAKPRRATPDTNLQKPMDSCQQPANDPFVVLEPDSVSSNGSSTTFHDPLEDFGIPTNLASTKDRKGSSNGTAEINDIFDGFSPAAASSSSPIDNFENKKSSLKTSRSSSPIQTNDTRESMESKSPKKASANNLDKNHTKIYSGTTMADFYSPNGFVDSSTDSTSNRNKHSLQEDSAYASNMNSQDSSPPRNSDTITEIVHDRWITVDEVQLFTQPTSAPPPSRPPPPSVIKQGPSYQKSAQPHKSSGVAFNFDKPAVVSSRDELEVSSYEEEADNDSTAAASAAAMKEAMDRAGEKLKMARKVREKEKEAEERAAEEAMDEEEKERLARANQEAREQEEREKEEREKMRREKEREREKQQRFAVDRATREARDRLAAEAREKSQRAAVERATREVRDRQAAELKERQAAERAAAEARERTERQAVERAVAEKREKAAAEKAAAERAAVERAAADARIRQERAAVEKINAEVRERAAERAAAAKERQTRTDNDLESFFGAPKQKPATAGPTFNAQYQSKGFSSEAPQRAPAGVPSGVKKASSAANIDDWTSIFTAPSGDDFQEVEGETPERRRARLDRHQRTRERAVKALAEKNERDMQAQRDQSERHRMAETLDAEIKRWAAGKEGNLRSLLSSLQYVLWPEAGWQPVSVTDVIDPVSVKKVYRKATLCVHPDKVQQKGATIQQKYVAEKVFDLLKEAWNKFNSEELF